MKRHPRLIFASTIAVGVLVVLGFSIRAYLAQNRPDFGKPVFASETVPASSATELKDDELVLGVEIDEVATAFPLRYVAINEHVNTRAGETPVCATW